MSNVPIHKAGSGDKPKKWLRCKSCGAAIVMKDGDRTFFKGFTEYNSRAKCFMVECYKCKAVNLSRHGRKEDTELLV